jgi:hypothetical protein
VKKNKKINEGIFFPLVKQNTLSKLSQNNFLKAPIPKKTKQQQIIEVILKKNKKILRAVPWW